MPYLRSDVHNERVIFMTDHSHVFTSGVECMKVNWLYLGKALGLLKCHLILAMLSLGCGNSSNSSQHSSV